MQHVLPGGDLVASGLSDLEAGKLTAAALLVSIGAPRLRSLGIAIPRTVAHPEHRLYELLAQSEPAAARGRYNALIRRLVSFERALACVASRRGPTPAVHAGVRGRSERMRRLSHGQYARSDARVWQGYLPLTGSGEPQVSMDLP